MVVVVSQLQLVGVVERQQRVSQCTQSHVYLIQLAFGSFEHEQVGFAWLVQFALRLLVDRDSSGLLDSHGGRTRVDGYVQQVGNTLNQCRNKGKGGIGVADEQPHEIGAGHPLTQTGRLVLTQLTELHTHLLQHHREEHVRNTAQQPLHQPAEHRRVFILKPGNHGTHVETGYPLTQAGRLVLIQLTELHTHLLQHHREEQVLEAGKHAGSQLPGHHRVLIR